MSTLLLTENIFASLAQRVFGYQKKHEMPTWFYEKLGKPVGSVTFADLVEWAEKVRQANIRAFTTLYPHHIVDISEPPHYEEKDNEVSLGYLVAFLRRIVYQLDNQQYDEGLLEALVEFLQDEILMLSEEFAQAELPPRVIDAQSLMQAATAIKSCRHWLISGNFSFIFLDELGKFYFEPLRKAYLCQVGGGNVSFEEVRYRHIDGMSIGTTLKLLRQLREVIPTTHHRYSWLDEQCRDLRYVFIEKVLEQPEVAV